MSNPESNCPEELTLAQLESVVGGCKEPLLLQKPDDEKEDLGRTRIKKSGPVVVVPPLMPPKN